MSSGVSVTFRCSGISLGKVIVVFRPDVYEVATRVFDKGAIRAVLGTTGLLAKVVERDLESRAVRVAGHFIHLGGRYPFSIDPATNIVAYVVWLNPQHLPQ